MVESKVEIFLIANARKLLQGMKQGERGAKRFFDTIKRHQQTLRRVSLATNVALTAQLFALKKLGESAGGIVDLERAFNRMADSAGTSGDTVIEQAQAITKALSKQQIMEAANTLELLGVGMENTARMIEIAKAAAIGLNKPLAFMLESLATGTARQSKLFLDNLGIIISVGDANKVYAETLGKTASELTDNERRAAFLYSTLQKGGDIIEKVGSSAESAAEPMQAWAASMVDAKNALGKALLPAINSVAEAIVPIIEGFGVWIEKNGPLARSLTTVTVAVTALAAAVSTLAIALPSLAAGFSMMSGALAVGGPLVAVFGAAWLVTNYNIENAKLKIEAMTESTKLSSEEIEKNTKLTKKQIAALNAKAVALDMLTGVVADEVLQDDRLHDAHVALWESLGLVRDGLMDLEGVYEGITPYHDKEVEFWTTITQALADYRARLKELGEETTDVTVVAGDDFDALRDRILQSLSDVLVRSMDAWIDTTATLFASGQNFMQSFGQAMALAMVGMFKSLIKMVSLEIMAVAIAEKAKALMKAPATGGISLAWLPVIAAAAAAGIGGLTALENKMKQGMPSFAMGGVVQRTGPVLAHEGEVIVNPRMPQGRGQEALAGAGGMQLVFNNYGTISGDDATAWIERNVARAIRGAK